MAGVLPLASAGLNAATFDAAVALVRATELPGATGSPGPRQRRRPCQMDANGRGDCHANATVAIVRISPHVGMALLEVGLPCEIRTSRCLGVTAHGERDSCAKFVFW